MAVFISAELKKRHAAVRSDEIMTRFQRRERWSMMTPFCTTPLISFGYLRNCSHQIT